MLVRIVFRNDFLETDIVLSTLQALSVVLILVDVGLSVGAIASEDEVFDRNSRIASNVFLGYFVFEITLRLVVSHES